MLIHIIGMILFALSSHGSGLGGTVGPADCPGGYTIYRQNDAPYSVCPRSHAPANRVTPKPAANTNPFGGINANGGYAGDIVAGPGPVKVGE